MAHPGWVMDGAWESSVSSAWAMNPLTMAALMAVVRKSAPMTWASGVPPWAGELRRQFARLEPRPGNHGRQGVQDVVLAFLRNVFRQGFSPRVHDVLSQAVHDVRRGRLPSG